MRGCGGEDPLKSTDPTGLGTCDPSSSGYKQKTYAAIDTAERVAARAEARAEKRAALANLAAAASAAGKAATLAGGAASGVVNALATADRTMTRIGNSLLFDTGPSVAGRSAYFGSTMADAAADLEKTGESLLAAAGKAESAGTKLKIGSTLVGNGIAAAEIALDLAAGNTDAAARAAAGAAGNNIGAFLGEAGFGVAAQFLPGPLRDRVTPIAIGVGNALGGFVGQFAGEAVYDLFQ